MAGDGQCDCRKDVFHILVYKVPREMGYDLSICLLKPILNPLQKKKKKDNRFFTLLLLLKISS